VINARTRRLAALAAVAVLTLLAAAPADAHFSRKKAIWGPVRVNGVSQFPIYRDLGVGIYQMELRWRAAAPTRPRNPVDPSDSAYRWPGEVDDALAEAAKYHMAVAIRLLDTPSWANGGRSFQWAPDHPRDFALFARAAARRYPQVRLWQIWGEPSRARSFQPLPRFESTGPRIYARMLDAAYVQLKRESRRNLVIGGNTFTTGEIAPLQYIKAMRLPGGRPPRMDLYGHNPFTRRAPDLRKKPLGFGYADFSDLDTLARYVDRYLGGRRGRRRKRIKLFLSEFTAPTDHANQEFNFWVTRATQARWLKAALRITNRWSRIYALGWYTLYDAPPNGPNGTHGSESEHGLLDWQGRKKPSYFVFRRG
jgi:hypothetical protein